MNQSQLRTRPRLAHFALTLGELNYLDNAIKNDRRASDYLNRYISGLCKHSDNGNVIQIKLNSNDAQNVHSLMKNRIISGGYAGTIYNKLNIAMSRMR